MANSSEAVQPQLIEDEIAELKRKLDDAQLRLGAVTDGASRAFPPEPTVTNNGLSFLSTCLRGDRS
jgi:hypothetical protein